MLEFAVVVVRLLQYAGAMILLGSSLLFVYAPAGPVGRFAGETPWARRLVSGGAVLLAFSSVSAVGFQASLFAGSFAEGFTAEAILAVVTWMDSGKAAVARAALAAAAAAVLLALAPRRSTWLAAAALGALATASLAWMGHGAVTEGRLGSIHLVSNVLHVLAAAIWLGALAGFVLLLLEARRKPESRHPLFLALSRFSGIGSVIVAVLVLTGTVNAWILVGPDQVAGLWDTPYGRLLLLKLLLFLAMLGLAAVNRFRLAPALGRDRLDASVGALQRSVAFETAAGAGVLLLVAWLGTLPPPAAV